MENIYNRIVRILSRIIGEEISQSVVTEDTPVMGNFENFDSLSIVGILTAIEKEFDFEVYDDEIDAEIFRSIGSLCAYVNSRIEVK